jgi:hypothetical protein
MARLGHKERPTKPKPPRLDTMPAVAAERSHDVYRQLGGAHSSPRLAPGGWDLAFDDGSVLELDEELHFNRYRLLTLQSNWADALPWKRDYVRFSSEREPDCLRAGKWGKRWSNPSAERMFAPAGTPGDFEGGGAPRWKQRALYDAMKDSVAASDDVRLIRVSVHDDVAGVVLGEALERKASIDLEALQDLISRRAR